MNERKSIAIAHLRDTVERFISAAEQVEKDPTATKKMLAISVEVHPAMEELVKAATGYKDP